MCDFILKLNEERRKFKSTSQSEAPIQEVNEEIVQPPQVDKQTDVSGIKDKSKLFSKFYENNSSNDIAIEEEDINVSRIFNNDSFKFTPKKQKESEISTQQEEFKNEGTDENVTPSLDTLPLSNILEKLKLSMDELSEVSQSFSSESLSLYHSELIKIYNGLESFVVKQDNSKPVEEVSISGVLKPQELNPVRNEHDALISKMTSLVSRLSEKAHDLETIKSKLDSQYKNESFSYSTPKEIKEKIRLFGKKFYEVFKVIQKDLNSNVKNEYWSLLQFSKDTKDYVSFREKVKSLADNYNTYLGQVNTKLTDIISNSVK